jgi:hypothetical protein
MSNFAKEFRDFKIRVLSGEVTFLLNEKRILKSRKELDFIFRNFKDDIITGSLALYLHGFIGHRKINDIDVLIKDKNKHSGYRIGSYGDIEMPNRLGYITFEHTNSALFGLFNKRNIYDVDFFLEPENTKYSKLNYKEYNLKIHSPMQVISYKVGMSEKDYKHRKDLYYIFNNLFTN